MTAVPKMMVQNDIGLWECQDCKFIQEVTKFFRRTTWKKAHIMHRHGAALGVTKCCYFTCKLNMLIYRVCGQFLHFYMTRDIFSVMHSIMRMISVSASVCQVNPTQKTMICVDAYIF